MKRLFFVFCAFCVCLTACAAPPKNSAVPTDTSGDTHTPLRAFVADGCLYYDTGLVSENTPRCGTLDGKFTKTLEDYQTPQKDGECNFEGADGYQNATSITKEVPIDGEGWCIFKKADVPTESFHTLPFCMTLTGRLPNAAKDCVLMILSESMEVTVRDIFWPMLSSQAFTKPKYQTCTLDDRTAETDKWGLTLTATNVTSTGCTLRFEQFGGTVEGTLQYGNPYTIEKQNEYGGWQDVPYANEAVWTMPAFIIPRNEITESNLDWSYIYGTLPPGAYRISKKVADFRQGHTYEPELYYAYFDITK